MPESRLNAVVLPAPFGPISACSVRSCHDDLGVRDRADAAEAFGKLARDQHRTVGRACASASAAGSGASCAISRPAIAAASTCALAERREQALGDADEAGRREHDEADEQEAEEQAASSAVQIERNSRNRMKNSAPSAGPRNERMPPMTTIASSSPENATEIGSAEAKRWWNTDEHAGERRDGGRRREGEQLVAVGRIADEARALLVLADRDQHVADRRAMEAPQQIDDQQGRSRRRAT